MEDHFIGGVMTSCVLGRIFYSTIFIIASLGHFTRAEVQYAAAAGVPFPEILVPCSGVLAFLGGISILLGYKARVGAWMIILFLVPVTLVMHKFWGLSDPIEAMLQRTMFMKNLSMLGGALLITHFGPGCYSLDARNPS